MDDTTPNDATYYSNLIGLIYDAAEKPELWPILLKEVCIYNADSPMLENQNFSPDIKKAALLEPHFTRAIHLNEHIAKLEIKNDTSNEILNRLPIGIVITNSDADVISMNTHAKTIFDTKRCLSLNAGKIKITSTKETTHLHQLIRSYASNTPLDEGSFILLRTNDNQQSTTSIWVTTSDFDNNAAMQHSGLVTLYIASSLIHADYNTQAIQQEFGLTEAETKLVKALTNGCHNLNSVAEQLGVSIHTVRTQIKIIFEKTNTNSQVELIKKVLTSPATIFGQLHPPQAISEVQSLYIKPSIRDAVHLHDGRHLGFVEYGDPNGEPIIFCHSLIHPDKQLFTHPEHQNNIPYRIISPKRPGFFNSSPVAKHYSLHDHARDIIQLADDLNLDIFKVLAHSNGCPYAAALAHDYPDRVSKLLLISPFVPPEMDNLNLLNTTDKYMYKFGKYMPRSAANRVCYMVMKSLSLRPDELITQNIEHVSASELAFLQTPELGNYLKSWVEASFPDRVKAVAYDLFVRIRPWGFNVQDIHTPVELWHAEDDSTVSVQCVHKFASIIPNCNTHYLQQGGHYIFFTNFEGISTSF